MPCLAACGLGLQSDRWLSSELDYWDVALVVGGDSGKLLGRSGSLESSKG